MGMDTACGAVLPVDEPERMAMKETPFSQAAEAPPTPVFRVWFSIEIGGYLLSYIIFFHRSTMLS